MPQNRVARPLQSFSSALDRYKRIAVPVTSNPGAERQHFRYLICGQFEGIDFAKGFSNFGIDSRQALENGHGIVVESHTNFIRYLRPLDAYFIRLPQSHNFCRNFVFE